MRAAIVKNKGTIPVMGHFDSPVATDGQVIINVSATALSRVSKFRSMGTHYSSEINFPMVAGINGVGTLEDGSHVYFALPTAPHGSLAEQTIVNEKLTVRLVGSGDKSVSKADMLSAVKGVFEMAAEGELKIATTEFALENIEAAWYAPMTLRPAV